MNKNLTVLCIKTIINRIIHYQFSGTATTILKRETPGNHSYYCDGVLYHEACSEMMGSSPTMRCSSVALPARCERNRSGYATDSEIGLFVLMLYKYYINVG